MTRSIARFRPIGLCVVRVSLLFSAAVPASAVKVCMLEFCFVCRIFTQFIHQSTPSVVFCVHAVYIALIFTVAIVSN